MAYYDKQEDAKIRSRLKKIYEQKIKDPMYTGGALVGGVGVSCGMGYNDKARIKKVMKAKIKERMMGSAIVGGGSGSGKRRRTTHKMSRKVHRQNKHSGGAMIGGRRRRRGGAIVGGRVNPWVTFFKKYKAAHPNMKAKDAMKKAAIEYRKR